MDLRRGLALVSMLIFVIVFTILSGVILGILANSTRDLESHVRDTKGFLSAEAGSVFAFDNLRRSQALPASVNVVWYYDNDGNPISDKPATIVRNAAAGPAGSDILDVTTDFSTPY